MKEEKPYALYYEQGHTAGLAGVPVDHCPHRAVGENRIELLSRRAAWLEGHSDGVSKRNQVVASGTHVPGKRKRPELPKPEPGRLVRSTVQRRYQRREQLEAGGRERYVDRRLRQIAADEQPVTIEPRRS